MAKCKICGCEFNVTKEGHYISRDDDKQGLSTAYFKEEVKLYDTFDCPWCGCQLIVQERKREYVPYAPAEEAEEGVAVEEGGF